MSKSKKNWSPARVEFYSARSKYRCMCSSLTFNKLTSDSKMYGMGGRDAMMLIINSTPDHIWKSNPNYASWYGMSDKWSIKCNSEGVQVKGRKGRW